MLTVEKQGELLDKAKLAQVDSFAWKSGTRVGCAILTSENRIVLGANIEGLWMTSIHSEVSAIAKMSLNRERIQAIAIVANCEKFTPCGACLDWLMQFSHKHTRLYIQNKDGNILDWRLWDLYPDYPKR